MKIMLTAQQLAEAREWLAECSWRDAEPEDIMDPSVVTDEEIERAVRRTYEGGVAAFVRDGHVVHDLDA